MPHLCVAAREVSCGIRAVRLAERLQSNLVLCLSFLQVPSLDLSSPSHGVYLLACVLLDSVLVFEHSRSKACAFEYSSRRFYEVVSS